MDNPLSLNLSDLSPLKEKLLHHRLYPLLDRPSRIIRFMESHVWCVWDFMSLLKALQARFTCTRVPWYPANDPQMARVINSIVVAEETDEDGKGGHLSHFELYLASMNAAEADTRPILSFVKAIREGQGWQTALEQHAPTQAIKDFVYLTLSIATSDQGHEIASAFALGREDLISPMFLALIGELADREPNRFERFYFYLRRHIELDGDEHGPAALAMVGSFCGTDANKRAGALVTAAKCLESRIRLWDEIADMVALL